MPQLTDEYIREARYAPLKGSIADHRMDTSWDAPLSFFLRIRPSGRRALVLRWKQGDKRKERSFPWPEFSGDDARREARLILLETRARELKKTLQDVRERLSARRNCLSDSTVANDRHTWSKLGRHFDLETPIIDIESKALQAALARLPSSTSSQAALLLREAFQLAVQLGWTLNDPAATLVAKHKRSKTRPPRWLEEIYRSGVDQF